MYTQGEKSLNKQREIHLVYDEHINLTRLRVQFMKYTETFNYDRFWYDRDVVDSNDCRHSTFEIYINGYKSWAQQNWWVKYNSEVLRRLWING